jgi:hypothetical protein
MKSKLICIVLFLFSLSSFAQKSIRQIIKGKIHSDSLEVVNVTVYNASSNLGSVSDTKGNFSIYAREKDTLVFESISFQSKKYILTRVDMDMEFVDIYLKTKINELNEIVVTPNTLSGVLEFDTKKIKTYTPDLRNINFQIKNEVDVRMGRVTNSALPSTMSPLTGINFIAIGKMLVSKDRRNQIREETRQDNYNKERLEKIETKTFNDHILELFPENYFTNDLGLQIQEIPLFLSYSETQPRVLMNYLKSENKLELMNYLSLKAAEFKKLDKKE